MAALATALLTGALGAPLAVQAQDPPFPTPLPMCYVQPDPANDMWPRAVSDSLGSTGGPVTFAGATLLANDSPSVAVRSVGPTSAGGGSITGTDPFTFTPSAPGDDSFPYEIIDAAGRTTMGIVKISVGTDVTLPTVSISSPLGGPVSGSVLVRASASDNVAVTGVTFFDGASPITTVNVSPFETMWATTLVGNGSHSLSAVARDGAGNTATSSPVVVNVSNVVMVTVPGVVGMTQTMAQTTIAGATLAVGTVTTASSVSAAGTVIGQSPAAGSSAASGSAVDFTVSLGPALVTVPSVVGAVQATAQSTITGAGLTIGGVTTASSISVASGSVVSQNPVGGATAVPGSPVAQVVSSGPPAPPAGGLVLAFGFEEASGNPVVDSSAAPVNGTLLGPTRVAAGKIGRALSFDGVNDWVTVPDTTASKLDLTSGMTLEAWVKPTAALSGWDSVVIKERGTTGLSYALYGHDGAPDPSGFAGPAGYLRPNPIASTTDQSVRQASHTPIVLNAWTHLATTYDGTNQRLYVNGVLVATKAQTGNIAASNQPLRIGGNAVWGEFFQGLIDEVRIYNRALSAAEITTDMTTPVVP